MSLPFFCFLFISAISFFTSKHLNNDLSTYLSQYLLHTTNLHIGTPETACLLLCGTASSFYISLSLEAFIIYTCCVLLWKKDTKIMSANPLDLACGQLDTRAERWYPFTLQVQVRTLLISDQESSIQASIPNSNSRLPCQLTCWHFHSSFLVLEFVP
jgi:hypothetical protein